jgi:dihydrofolate reductase
MLSMIVAMSEKTRVIGLDGDMPWKLGADLRRFKTITTGHTVVMGRKTWESIPAKYRPLPNRRNIVLSRNLDYEAEGAEVFASIETVMQLPSWGPQDHIFLIGGSGIFEAGLTFAQRLYVTLVDYDGPGDTFFPEDPWERYEPFQEEAEENLPADEKNSHATRYLVMQRRTAPK